MAAFLAFWFFNKGSAITPKKLLAEHIAIPRSENDKSTNSSIQSQLDSLSEVGVKYFKNGAYEDALATYQIRYSLDNQRADRLYEGVALLQLGRYPEAINVFQSGPKTGNLADQFKWHLIVAYYLNGDQAAFENTLCDYDDFFQRGAYEKLKNKNRLIVNNSFCLKNGFNS